MRVVRMALVVAAGSVLAGLAMAQPPAGPGGPGGFGGDSRPGQVLSPFAQDALKLTPE